MPIDEQVQEAINRIRREKELMAQAEEAVQRAREGVNSGVFQREDLAIEFAERSLIEEKLLMRMPVDFAVMDPDLAALKYPSEHRPGLIFSDESGSLSLAFNHTQNILTNDKVPEFKEFLVQNLKRLQSGSRFLADGVFDCNGQTVGFVEFISPAIDGEIYNLACVTPLEGRALLINFNCLEEDMELWQPLARAMVETMRPVPVVAS